VKKSKEEEKKVILEDALNGNISSDQVKANISRLIQLEIEEETRVKAIDKT